jgi:phage terminase small subunit
MNAKHARFVEEYMVDRNATQAAIRAGYSPRTARAQGSRLLTNADISAAVQAAEAAIVERTKVTQEYVVGTLTEVVERCMERAPVMVRDPLDGRKWIQKEDEDGNHVWQFDAKGANQALGLLGKHLGIFTDKKEISFPNSGGVLMVPAPISTTAWAEAVAARQAQLAATPALAPLPDET